MAKIYKFDSGLTLLYETNKINKSTSVDLRFDCGARCDGDLPGLSHFCEHMFFTGTDKLNKQEASKRYFDFIRCNAYTTNTDISFEATIITKRFADYLDTVHDMICNSTFKPAAIKEEQKVVVQEIVRDSDNHENQARRLVVYDLFGDEYFKIGVLGTKQSVNSITSKDVKKYVKKYFVKNNCVISVCSPLSFNKVKNIVKKHFDDVMPSNNLKPLPYYTLDMVDGDFVKTHKKNIDKNFFSIIFKSKKHGPDLKYLIVLDTIANIIEDFGDGLTKELRLDNSLIYAMNCSTMINKVCSHLAINTEMSKENVKPCIDVITGYISKLVETGFTNDQLVKEKQKDEYYSHTHVSTPERIKGNLNRIRFHGRFIDSKEIHDAVQKLTLDEVNQAIKELFTNAQVQVFVYGNADKKDVYTIKQIKDKLKY